MKKIYSAPLYAFLIFWIINLFTNLEILEQMENITLFLFGVFLAIQIIRDAKESSLQKESCSGLITQLSFICPPNLKSESPYKKVEILGYIEGLVSITMLTIEITELFG